MRHELFSTVNEMISPDSLSSILGRSIAGVERVALAADFAHSGSGLEFLETRDAEGVPGPRLVLKRIAAEWDWLMRVTEDEKCRSTTVWTTGILDRLPSQCAPPMLAGSYDELGWAILMHDYGDTIMTNKPFSPAVNALLLDTIAAIHAMFLEDPVAGEHKTGLCSPYQIYRMFAPATAQAQIKRGPCGEIPARILEGWTLAREVMPRDVMEVITPLLADPTPLCAALGQYPSTLVHGDYRHSNLGVLSDNTDDITDPCDSTTDRANAPGERDRSNKANTSGDRDGSNAAGRSSVPDAPEEPARAVLLDWQLATYGPPAIELGRYLGANSPLLPEHKDACLRRYHDRLVTYLGKPPLWWQPQLELGLLGGFLQDGWAIVLKATNWHVGAEYRDHWKDDLLWWAEQVRRGAVRLEKG